MDNKVITDILFSEIDRVVLDGNAVTSELPLSMTYANVSSSEDLKSALDTVFSEKAMKKHVLVVTDSEDFKDIILSINRTISNGKIAVICKGVFFADEAVVEMIREKNLLHTNDGIEYYPGKQLSPDMLYADENGRLLLREGTVGEPLYANDGSCWGCVLSEGYTLDNMKGKLTESLKECSLGTKARIVLKLLDMYDSGTLSDADSIMLFDTSDCVELLGIGEPTQWSAKSVAALICSVYLGGVSDCKDKLELLINARLAMSELPALLFEDMLDTYSQQIFPSVSAEMPSTAQLRNTAERILITTES
ncbi:MAG: hypothetical protein K6C68_12815 [Ruminococcus sp.]|nr:hypothetical protein [Ruminococcus sp.]